MSSLPATAQPGKNRTCHRGRPRSPHASSGKLRWLRHASERALRHGDGADPFRKIDLDFPEFCASCCWLSPASQPPGSGLPSCGLTSNQS